MKNGRSMYGNADIGYNILNTRNGKLGGFVGYHSIYNRANGYGCNQIATDDVCIPPEDVSIRYPILSDKESRRGLAVGLNAQMPIADRFKLEVDAAYLPYVTREGLDNHWLRSISIRNQNPAMAGERSLKQSVLRCQRTSQRRSWRSLSVLYHVGI